MMPMRTDRGSRTINQFSRQFRRYEEIANGNFRTSLVESGKYQDEVFVQRILGMSIQGKRVMEVGAGMGRWSVHLLQAKPSLLVIVEPSDAMEHIEQLLPKDKGITTVFRQEPIEHVQDVEVDVVISIGVIHHIFDQEAALQAIHRSLAPGGKCALRVYRRPESYVVFSLMRAFRLLCRPCPDWLLAFVAKVISLALVNYGSSPASIFGRFPFHRYCAHDFQKLDPKDRELTIYDQLRPRVANYFSEDSLHKLLESIGFTNIDVEPFDEVALVARCVA